jgi:uncharacterized protein YbjT (DUF2867 family)
VTGTSAPRPRLLLIGGGGGLVGRAVLPAFLPHFRIRSVHRHPAPNEGPAVEWVCSDVNSVNDWAPLLDDVQVILNLAWYRWESEANFRALHDGLRRMLEAAVRAGTPRVLQVSVPLAPARLEKTLPYLVYKRRFDAGLARSGLSHRIVRPTMLFGPGDVLVSVMLRLMRRYPLFPMFGDGSYHVSPIAVSDLAAVLLQQVGSSEMGTVDLGGPERMTYRELTDRMFEALRIGPRYWRLSASAARRLTRLMVAFGSTTLYPYEIEWLMSDLLGLPAYSGLGRPLQRLGPYLAELVRHQTDGRPSGSLA